MKIIKLQCLRGPNYWSTYRTKLIQMTLDLENFDQSTRDIYGLEESLEKLMPSLYDHRCIPREPGGFFKSIRQGTNLGHVIEHIALELQSLADMECGFGRTFPTKQKGVYTVIFEYQVEKAGRYAAESSVEMMENIMRHQPVDLERVIERLKEIERSYGPGPSTRAIMEAAKRRKIPYRRLDDNSLILFGQGIHQKIIQATIASTTSNIGVETVADKERTKKILSENFIPVPEGDTVYDTKELWEAVSKFGFPLVIKPLDGNHGRGITTNIRSNEQVLKAFELAKKISDDVIIERYFAGSDYRFLLINFKVEAVARRVPAMVIGDGKTTIRELIQKTNADPNRGEHHEKVLTKIKIDGQSDIKLQQKGYTYDTILPDEEILFLKDAANLSSGGTARDVTDIVHPHNIFLAERIARLMNLDICGIDAIVNDITNPITQNNGAVLEVNAAPGFRMHLSPEMGLQRDVGEPVIKMLFPPQSKCRIPIVAVTGTNGKTTTTRLIAHFAKNAGHSVGFCTTDGIYIDNHEIYKGDCSGPSSAETILRDPSVDFAVLECARGGILRSGLGFDKCNISIVTNITEDHLGLNGIDTLDELAKVKSVVPRSTFTDGYAILNADDDLVYGMKDYLDCNIALFSTDSSNPRMLKHCAEHGYAATIEKGYFIICRGEWKVRVGKVKEVPLTFDGNASCMIKNILPSILAASLCGWDPKMIRESLFSFTPGPENTPGRMNIFDVNDARIMVDYAHNRDGFVELNQFMKNVSSDLKIGIVGCTGDRRDSDIQFMASLSAQMFDKLIIRHDADGRGRTNEEITKLIADEIFRVKPNADLVVISDEMEAIQHAISIAHKGAFIVDTTDEIDKSIQLIRDIIQKKSSGISETFSN